jgi:hypothetical protein
MTVDLLPDQTLKVLLPGGGELLLSNRDGATRIEHWQGHSLSTFFTLHVLPEPKQQQQVQQLQRQLEAHLDRPTQGVVCPTSRPI